MLSTLLKSTPPIRVLEVMLSSERILAPDELVIRLPRDMAALSASVTEERDGLGFVYWAGWRPRDGYSSRGAGQWCYFLSAGRCRPGDEILVRDSGGGGIFWRARVL